jgi:outer membrane protein
MIRNNYLILTALLAMQAPQVADAQTKQWTLRECEDYAVAHNITIKQREVAREKQTYTLSTARNSRLPDLTGSVGQNFNFGRGLTEDNIYENTNTTSTNFQLNTSIPLFTGFQIPENIKLSRLNLEALTEDLEKAKNDIRMQVAQAYVQILYDEEMSAVAQRQIAIDSMQVARLRAFVENGKASVSELSQQEATLASSRLTATQADNKRLISLLTLTQLLELPTPEGFAIVSPNVEKVASIDGLMTPDDIYLEAIGFKPEIRSEELRLKGAEHSINIAKAGHYPKLNLNAGLSTNYNTISDFESESFGDQLRHKFAQFVGLNLSIPIFNRFQVRNNIRSAKADRHNQMLKLESVKKTLYKEIQQVYYNVLNAHSKVNSSKEAVQSSQTAFELMQAKYENGKANITEFNEAKNKYLKAESDFVQARYEQLYQRALLDFYRGRELDF